MQRTYRLYVGKLQVCNRIPSANKTPRATELPTSSGITGGKKSQAAGKSLRVTVGKCLTKWEEITEPAEVYAWCMSGSDFQVRVNHEMQRSHNPSESRGNHESCKNNEKFWSIGGVIDSRPSSWRAPRQCATRGSTLEKSEVNALVRSIAQIYPEALTVQQSLFQP